MTPERLAEIRQYHEESDAFEIPADSGEEAAEEFCEFEHARGNYEYANNRHGLICVRVKGHEAIRRYEVEARATPHFYATEVGT